MGHATDPGGSARSVCRFEVAAKNGALEADVARLDSSAASVARLSADECRR